MKCIISIVFFFFMLLSPFCAKATLLGYEFSGTATLEDINNLLGDAHGSIVTFQGTIDFDTSTVHMTFPGFSVNGSVHTEGLMNDSFLYMQPLFFDSFPDSDERWKDGWGEAGAIDFHLEDFDPCDFWFFYVYDFMGPDSGEILFSGSIENLEQIPVPEPSTIFMFLIAVGVVFARFSFSSISKLRFRFFQTGL